MKKYFFMAVAGMLALSSCSNDNDEIVNENTPHKMTFMAGYSDGADTRATMNFNGDKKVSFDANDQISILSTKNANAPFTTSAGGASAEFTGTASNDSKFYAVYPYTDGLTLDGTTIKGVTIPTTQTNSNWGEDAYSEDYNWDPKAPVALAVAEPGNALQFKNLCAILKVKVKYIQRSAFKVKVSASESLAGTFDLNTETYALTDTSGSTSVSAEAPYNDYLQGYISFFEPRNIYIAIAPGTYTNFKVVVDLFGGYAEENPTKTKAGSVTFEKGKVYDLGSFRQE